MRLRDKRLAAEVALECLGAGAAVQRVAVCHASKSFPPLSPAEVRHLSAKDWLLHYASMTALLQGWPSKLRWWPN